MRIGLIPELFTLDVEHNLNQMLKWLQRSEDENLDLICFGEACLQGFGALNADYDHDLAMAISQDDDIVTRLQDACHRAKTGLGFGYIEKDEGSLFSSYMLISADGRLLHNFRRVSPGWKLGQAFKDARYREGSDYANFDYKGKKITVAICGDLWHDDLIERFRVADSDFLLWPLYINYEIETWEAGEKDEYAQRVAGLNRPVLMVNCFDDGEDIARGGAFVFEQGRVSQELPMGEKGILLVDC
ncbi:MAG: carbon-nitrogen hydrolase family protein [Oscillospiraceae bacterium]|jgi:predicted amidohydrolase